MDEDGGIPIEIKRPKMFMLWAADGLLFFRPEDEGHPAVPIQDGAHLTVDLYAGEEAHDGPQITKFTIVHGQIAPIPTFRSRLASAWRAFRDEG